jgi:hypothetical protein
MVKHSRKRSRIQKRKSHKRITKKMFGGDFSEEENQQLVNLGFTENDINDLSDNSVGFNIVQLRLREVNPATGNPFTPQEIIQQENEVDGESNSLNISNISNDSDDSDDVGDNFINPYRAPNNNPLTISDLNDSNVSSINTTYESEPDNSIEYDNVFNWSDVSQPDSQPNSVGGKKKRKTMKKRKTIKKRKTMKKRTIRKQRGGTCFGNGVGANSYDPSFSIYNTREPSLFPYKPTN